MNPIEHLTWRVNQLARITVLQRNKAFEELGITGTQHSYILNVCREPGIVQDYLAKKLYVNKSNVARQVAQLQELGFITRSASETDKRAVCLYPTEKAQKIYPVIREVLHEWNQYLVADFTDEEKETLAGLMRRAVKRAADYIGEEGQEE